MLPFEALMSSVPVLKIGAFKVTLPPSRKEPAPPAEALVSGAFRKISPVVFRLKRSPDPLVETGAFT